MPALAALFSGATRHSKLPLHQLRNARPATCAMDGDKLANGDVLLRRPCPTAWHTVRPHSVIVRPRRAPAATARDTRLLGDSREAHAQKHKPARPTLWAAAGQLGALCTQAVPHPLPPSLTDRTATWREPSVPAGKRLAGAVGGLPSVRRRRDGTLWAKMFTARFASAQRPISARVAWHAPDTKRYVRRHALGYCASFNQRIYTKLFDALLLHRSSHPSRARGSAPLQRGNKSMSIAPLADHRQ